MGIIAKTNLFSLGKGSSGIPSQIPTKQTVTTSAEAAQSAARLRRMASDATAGAGKTGQQASQAQSVVSASFQNASALREARTNKKKTSLAMKKLQYNFKKVSSEIMRSKTSTAAKAAASKARREVLRLKRLKGSEQYDSEELEAAITHAKSMERIAKKKAAHLEQEEMIRVTEDGSGTLSLRDALRAENEREPAPEEAAGETDANAGLTEEEEAAQAQRAYEQELARQEMQAMQEELSAEMAEETEELMNELSEEMQEMMEELDLMETLAGPVGEMSEEDFKMLQIKHRSDEMKEIAEADKEYLKVLFDKLQREKAAGDASSVSAAAGTSGSSFSFGSGAPVSVSGALASIDIAMPVATVSVPEGAAIDVSV